MPFDPVNSPKDKSGKHSDSVVFRFWKNVHRRQDHQCWNWVGSKAVRGGYGQLYEQGRLLKGHRLSWEIHFGLIPPNMLIRHLCNNPACCNPSHLLPGTPRDNHLDMQRSNRMYVPISLKGEENSCSKLTEDQVAEIYCSDARGVDLAKKYNISPSAVSCIRLGKTWRHVTSHQAN